MQYTDQEIIGDKELVRPVRRLIFGEKVAKLSPMYVPSIFLSLLFLTILCSELYDIVLQIISQMELYILCARKLNILREF